MPNNHQIPVPPRRAGLLDGDNERDHDDVSLSTTPDAMASLAGHQPQQQHQRPSIHPAASVLENPLFPAGKLPSSSSNPIAAHHQTLPHPLLSPHTLLPVSGAGGPLENILVGLSPLECIALAQQISDSGCGRGGDVGGPDIDALEGSLEDILTSVGVATCGDDDDVDDDDENSSTGMYNVPSNEASATSTPGFWAVTPQTYYQRLSSHMSPEEAADRVALGLTPPPPEMAAAYGNAGYDVTPPASMSNDVAALHHHHHHQQQQQHRLQHHLQQQQHQNHPLHPPDFQFQSPSSSPTSGSVVSSSTTPINLPQSATPDHSFHPLVAAPPHPPRAFPPPTSLMAAPLSDGGLGLGMSSTAASSMRRRETATPSPALGDSTLAYSNSSPNLVTAAGSPSVPPRSQHHLLHSQHHQQQQQQPNHPNQQQQPGMPSPFSSNTLPHPHSNMKVRFTPELEGRGTDV